MKYKILKTFKLAKPKIGDPDWLFRKGQIFDTDDEYLITRFVTLDFVKKIKRKQKSNEKQHITMKNKMHLTENNKTNEIME